MKRDKLVALIFASVCIAASALCALAVHHFMNKAPVVGPHPNEVRTMCLPITQWVVSQHETTGSWPDGLVPEHRAILDRIPYRWSQHHGSLNIGLFQWPKPLYSLRWSAQDGWSWSMDYEMNDEQIEAVLQEHGYNDTTNTTAANNPLHTYS